MARQPAAVPQMQISAWTALKAGFFGAIGFFIAQLILAPVILLILLICGVSLVGLGAAASSAGTTQAKATSHQADRPNSAVASSSSARKAATVTTSRRD